MNVHCGLFRNLVFVQSVDAVPLSDDVLSLQTLRVLQGWRSGVEELGHKFSAGPRLQTQRVSGATWLRKRQLGDQNKQVRQTWTQNMCACLMWHHKQIFTWKASLFIRSPHPSPFPHVRVPFNLAQLLIITNQCQQWQRKPPYERTGNMTQLAQGVHFHYEGAHSTDIVRIEE